MAFAEIQFPTELSYGSSGGPGFDTRLIELDSGQLRTVKRRTQSLRRFNAKEAARSLEDLTDIRRFYLAIGGVGTGFRFKDWSDYTTASDDFSAHASTDVVLGTGDDTEDEYQLKKLYTYGAYTHTRTILKPVSGTTLVSLDDTDLPANIGGTDYSYAVNTATGIVTITPAPAAGLVVKAGFEFDVPVMFGPEVDKLFDISIDGFNAGTIPNIPLIEILSPTPLSDMVYAGGSYDHGVLASNTSVTESLGRFHIAAPVTTNGGSPWQLRLPDASTFAGGGVWFAFANEGAADLDVADSGGSVLITLNTDELAEIWVSVATGGGRTLWAK